MPDVSYPFDTTGEAATNLIQGELHTLTSVNSATYRILIPTHAPFYLHNLLIEHISQGGVASPLTEGVDYYAVLPYMAASRSTGRSIYGGLSFISTLPQGTIRVKYQTIGGPWVADRAHVYEQLLLAEYNKRTTWWDVLTNVQQIFPPTAHEHPSGDIAGTQELLTALEQIRVAILAAPTNPIASYMAHMLSQGNVHGLTKADLGLENIQNLHMASDQEVLERQSVDRYVTLRQILMLFPPA